MRIHSYSLMRDVVAAQQRPQIPSTLWHTAPLLVMNNFKGSKPLSLASALLQHLFPSINVNTVKLSSCQVSPLSIAHCFHCLHSPHCFHCLHSCFEGGQHTSCHCTASCLFHTYRPDNTATTARAAASSPC